MKNNELNTIVYMSGTKNKKTAMEKMLKAYKEDSELDRELGVISKEEYEIEAKAAEILEKSLENYIVF